MIKYIFAEYEATPYKLRFNWNKAINQCLSDILI